MNTTPKSHSYAFYTGHQINDNLNGLTATTFLIRSCNEQLLNKKLLSSEQITTANSDQGDIISWLQFYGSSFFMLLVFFSLSFVTNKIMKAMPAVQMFFSTFSE